MATAKDRLTSRLLIPLVCLLAGCSSAAIAQPKAAAPSSGALEVVLTGKPARKSLVLTTTQPARIEGLEQTPIHSKIAAYVGQVLGDFGDEVKQHQVLLKLIAPELDAAVMQRKALVDQARAQLVQAEAEAKAADAAVVTARSRVAESEAGSDRAQSDLTRWRSEYQRIQQLASSGSINRQVVDETQQKLGAAEASLKQANASIDATQALVQQAQAETARAASDVAAAKANVKVAEANLVQAEAEQSYLTIRSPFAGIIIARHVDSGHFVQPAGASAQPLFVVARNDKLRVFVPVPETEAGYLDIGQTAILDVPALRGAEFKTQITRTSYALDEKNRSLTAIIDLDNPDRRLRPGLYATAKITLQERTNVLVLPSAAVVRRDKEAFCYRLIGGKAAQTRIQVGIKVGDEFEVTSGISENDIVILNKASALKDGQSVEVLKQEPKK